MENTNNSLQQFKVPEINDVKLKQWNTPHIELISKTSITTATVIHGAENTSHTPVS